MAEPQLSIRSAKAKNLAQALARRTGLSLNRVVEQALAHYDNELRAVQAIDAAWDLAAEGRKAVAAGTTSAHDDFYDESGLPR
ncbi:MAG: type II toxin-antitoxin system VapB family antitoxin [Alphaproteobacteria bacterium]|nr:type II toxin-antitoxin system VapB family antitoxin [Alphaproteobacteria bacterium]